MGTQGESKTKNRIRLLSIKNMDRGVFTVSFFLPAVNLTGKKKETRRMNECQM